MPSGKRRRTSPSCTWNHPVPVVASRYVPRPQFTGPITLRYKIPRLERSFTARDVTAVTPDCPTWKPTVIFSAARNRVTSVLTALRERNSRPTCTFTCDECTRTKNCKSSISTNNSPGFVINFFYHHHERNDARERKIKWRIKMKRRKITLYISLEVFL